MSLSNLSQAWINRRVASGRASSIKTAPNQTSAHIRCGHPLGNKEAAVNTTSLSNLPIVDDFIFPLIHFLTLIQIRFAGGWSQAEVPEENPHSHTESTCRIQAARLQSDGWLRPKVFLLWCNSANHCSTVPPWVCFIVIKCFVFFCFGHTANFLNKIWRFL